MQITEQGTWAAYTPDAVHPLAPPNALYWKNQDGVDWYVYSRRTWNIVGGVDATNTIKILLDEDNRVRIASRDATTLMPPVGRVIELPASEAIPLLGSTLDGDHFVALAGATDALPPNTIAAPPKAPVATLQTVKAECARRIYAVASDSAQKNMTANAAAGNFSADDMAAWKAGVAWISSMQAICRALIAAADVTYADDAHWPPCPQLAVALAAKY